MQAPSENKGQKLNDKQLDIANAKDGLLVVDAGPGTGKTHTITQRYINLITDSVSPAEILMVTFTRNSAAEMRERIRKKLIEEGTALKKDKDPEKKNLGTVLLDARDNVRTSTFDAYCLHIVLGSPEIISDFFGLKETLSRGASLVENETMNRAYFQSFYSEFSKEYSHLYRRGGKDYPAIMADHVGDLYSMIVRLMSFGIIPLADDEWFDNGKKRMIGDTKAVLAEMAETSGQDLAQLDYGRTGKHWAPDVPQELCLEGTADKDTVLPDWILREAAEEDRELLIYFIRHVYYEYIRQSVRDNRLTFSLVKIFAFAALYNDENVRKQNSVEYLMVDEFQDTDEMQLMICLMLLKKGNLCVVGDWKQGIYGFRNATVDNIRMFKTKVCGFIDSLGDRVAFGFDDQPYKWVSLEVNYRSTRAILDPAFKAIRAKATMTEKFTPDEDSITELVSHKESDAEKKSGLYLKHTACEYWYSDEDGSEYEDIADKIVEYLESGRYSIVEDDGTVREPRFGDIAVLFRKFSDCYELYKVLKSRGIPAFLQGDTEIMSSPPGKLALAWLRFVNDSGDRRGIAAIMAYMGYTLPQIRYVFGTDDREEMLSRIPLHIIKERNFLIGKRKRPNNLLTSIFAFHRIGEGDTPEDLAQADIAQAIIRVVSSSYSGSLMTIPDIIRLLEEDIEQSTTYNIDSILGTGAVTVQTMHKAKGLEYPIVVVGGLSTRKMPSPDRNTGILRYDDVHGIRCRREYISAGGTDGIVDSWRCKVVDNARTTDYDEERRVLFVATSRAKQYMFITSNSEVSNFYLELAGGKVRGARPEKLELTKDRLPEEDVKEPSIPRYTRRRQNIAVHDIMEYKEGAEESGKGKQHGKDVHSAAEQMALGKPYDTSLTETVYISKVIEPLKAAVLKAEYDCSLPVGDVTVRGTIDLLADFGDRIEIHDWKTDIDKRNLDSYVTQLSVYGHAAAQSRNVPVRCFVDFVAQNETVEISMIPMEEIADKVQEFLQQSADVGE